MNIYVGNLAKEVTAEDLREAFGQFGAVSKASVITDKMTGMPRGFGFVEMDNKEEGQAAMSGLNGKELKGRAISVNEARPKSSGGGHGGGFGGGRGGFGGGRGEGQGSRGVGRGKWKGSSW